MNRCEQCDMNEVNVHLKMDAFTMHLCMNCYNELMSKELKVDLDQLVETFSLKDYQGVSRTFNVERRLFPVGIYLEAEENIEYGYKFGMVLLPRFPFLSKQYSSPADPCIHSL